MIDEGFSDWLAEALVGSLATAGTASAMHVQAEEALNATRQMRESLTPLLRRMAKEDSQFLSRYRLSMLTAFVDAAMQVSGADMANIQLFDAASSALRIAAQRGFSQPFLDYFDCVHDGQAACGTAFKNRSQVIVEDVVESHVFLRTRALEVVLDAGVRAVQSTPLVGPSGSVLGIISTHRRKPWRPSNRDLRLLDLLARSAGEWVELRMHLQPSPDDGFSVDES
jgi:GAF domain-containing protein